MPFCDVKDVVAYIPKLKTNTFESGTTLDVSTTAIQTLIDNQYALIVERAKNFKYTLPTSNPNPVTNRELILYLMNIETVVADVILRRSGAIDIRQRKRALVQQDIAKRNFADYFNGRLKHAFTQVLPVDSLCTPLEAAAYASGLPLTSSSTPNLTTVQLWCSAESAFIYTLATLYGYKTDYSTMTDYQKSIYKTLVAEQVGSHIVRTRSSQFPALDEQANILLTNSINRRKVFRNRKYGNTLKLTAT